DFEVFGEAGVLAVFVNGRFEVLDAVREHGTGAVVELAKLIAGSDVFNGGGLVFAGKKVIAAGVVEPFADIFEGVGKGPADTNGFFGQAERGIVENPAELVGEEEWRIEFAVDGEGG